MTPLKQLRGLMRSLTNRTCGLRGDKAGSHSAMRKAESADGSRRCGNCGEWDGSRSSEGPCGPRMTPRDGWDDLGSLVPPPCEFPFATVAKRMTRAKDTLDNHEIIKVFEERVDRSHQEHWAHLDTLIKRSVNYLHEPPTKTESAGEETCESSDAVSPQNVPKNAPNTETLETNVDAIFEQFKQRETVNIATFCGKTIAIDDKSLCMSIQPTDIAAFKTQRHTEKLQKNDAMKFVAFVKHRRTEFAKVAQHTGADASISANHCNQLAAILGYSLTKKELRRVVKHQNAEGQLSYDAFFEALEPYVPFAAPTPDEQRSCDQFWKIYDPQETGFVSRRVFANVLMTWGNQFSEQESQQAITALVGDSITIDYRKIQTLVSPTNLSL